MGWIRVPFVFGGHKTEMHFPIRAILSLKDPSATFASQALIQSALSIRKPEGIAPRSFPEVRESGTAGKEIPEGLFKVTQDLLQNLRRTGLEPVHFASQLRQFLRLTEPVQAMPPAPYLALFQRQIPQKTCCAADLPQKNVLRQ